jgi:hypothetical protein
LLFFGIARLTIKKSFDVNITKFGSFVHASWRETSRRNASISRSTRAFQITGL